MATDPSQGNVVPVGEPQAAAPDLKVLWLRAALFIAIVGVLGSLHLSLGMELKACPLCFYQRAFMMSAAAALLFGMLLPGIPAGAATVLALPSAFAGASVAAFHSRLVFGGVLECPGGITGMPVPYESFLVFFLLVAFLVGDLLHRNIYVTYGVGAILLGLIFCTTCIRGTPPMAEPTAPYPAEPKIDMCRKVYQAKAGD
jgi:hypothetical protein